MLLVCLLDEKVFEPGVPLLRFQIELVLPRILAKRDESTVIIWIQHSELLLDILCSFLLIPDAFEVCINNEDYTPLMNVELTKHLVNHSLFVPV